MPSCHAALECMRTRATLGEWDLCLELDVHANLHPWMGGAWECEGGDDFAARAADDPATYPGAVLDFVGASVGNAWLIATEIPLAGSGAPVASCPEPRACVMRLNASDDDHGGCKCECTLDVDAIDDDAVFANVSGVNFVLELFSGSYLQDSFLTHETTQARGPLLLRPPLPAASRARAAPGRRSGEAEPPVLSPPLSRPQVRRALLVRVEAPRLVRAPGRVQPLAVQALVQPGRAGQRRHARVAVRPALQPDAPALRQGVNARERESARTPARSVLLRSAPGTFPLSL